MVYEADRSFKRIGFQADAGLKRMGNGLTERNGCRHPLLSACPLAAGIRLRPASVLVRLSVSRTIRCQFSQLREEIDYGIFRA
jgi:hypothetical protein